MKLDSLYKNADEAIQSLDFLKHLKLYVDYVENDEFLSKVVQSMRENTLNESISIIRESLKSDSAIDTHLRSELQDDIAKKYPLRPYDQIKEACSRLEYINQYTNDEEVPNDSLDITEETAHGTFSSSITKSGILTLTKHHYRNNLKYFHEGLLKQIEVSKSKGGVFSKYFDYDEITSTLYFLRNQIQINNRKVPTSAHYILAYIFKNNPFEQHYYDELQEEKVLLESKPWKSYYDGCIDIQAKVEDATGISDFLDFSSGKGFYVRINPTYSMIKL